MKREPRRKAAKKTSKKKPGRKVPARKTGPVILEARLGIKNIAELRKTLSKRQGSESPVVVDASGVQAIDTAVLQLLVAFANSLQQRSAVVDWNNPSAEFREAADLLDLGTALGIVGKAAAAENNGLCPVF